MGQFEISQQFLRAFCHHSVIVSGGLSISSKDQTSQGDDTYVDYSGTGPEIGSCRVSFKQVRGDVRCSVITEQTDSLSQKIRPGGQTLQFGIKKHKILGCGICTPNTDLGDIWICHKGDHSIEDLVKMEQSTEFFAVCCLRVLGYILLIVGWSIIFSPITTLIGAIPFLGAFANFGIGLIAFILGCSCATFLISIFYLAVHPLTTVISVGLLTAAAWGLRYVVLQSSVHPAPV